MAAHEQTRTMLDETVSDVAGSAQLDGGCGVDQSAQFGTVLDDIVRSHACFAHPLFEHLENCQLDRVKVAALLRNYDAHAGVLRRLLLKAAAFMPETAVGYILENVRNEYGNGVPAHRHELQLRDLAGACGVTARQFRQVRIQPGVRAYIRAATILYAGTAPDRSFYRPAVAAGAITGTEIMALQEFRAMQRAFAPLGLENHVWFDHVNVEADHTSESLALADHFIDQYDAREAVLYGLTEILNANSFLYDGLLMAVNF